MPCSRTALPLLALLLLLACPLPRARADILVGGIAPGAGVGVRHPVLRFDDAADGAAAPAATLGGGASGLLTPMDGAHEAGEGVIYVADYFGQSIRVFPAGATGDAAPLRVLDPPLLGQPRTVLPLPAHGELMVIASNCCIYTWPLQASGNAAPRLRAISWGGVSGGQTALNNPASMVYLPATDEVAVIDYDATSPFAAKVVFHARTGNGNVAPTRILQGADTAGAAGLAHDPDSGLLFLLASRDIGGGDRVGEIRVFDAAASGADPALYAIAGPATGLGFASPRYLSGITFDARRQRLLVAVAGNGAPMANRLLVFDAAASGDAVPLQELAGSALGDGSIGRPFLVPADGLFADGFEG